MPFFYMHKMFFLLFIRKIIHMNIYTQWHCVLIEFKMMLFYDLGVIIFLEMIACTQFIHFFFDVTGQYFVLKKKKYFRQI